MRNPMLAAGLAVVALSFTAPVSASEVDHYEGRKADTLAEAVTNLREYNARLEKLLDQEELSAADLEKVHQLTYTLENALKRINTELGGIAGDLETVHLASERQETDTVRSKGRAYLEQVDTLID
jgi:hypothetical protein